MRIGHYVPVWAHGGITSYVRRIAQAQNAAGDVVFFISRVGGAPPGDEERIVVQDEQDLFGKARSLGLDILHLHKEIGVPPSRGTATIRTMHGNQASCPSGTRYLSRWGRPCDRTYSLMGCLRGHLIDRCGSCRPQKLHASFERIGKELHVLPSMPTLTVSRFLKEQMIRAGYDASRIHVLLSPAPQVAEPYVPPLVDRPPRFVFIGRIVPEKGLSWLLRAFARMRTDAHLDVAGDGHLLQNMRGLAAQLGLERKVTFHGWVTPAEVSRLMRAARAVVVPSVWHEPAGLVTMEAAAHGRPVIASRVGGIPEYAEEGHALLVPPNHVEQMAQSLRLLATDADLAGRMGRYGMHLACTRFSLRQFTEQLRRQYLGAISGDAQGESLRAVGVAAP